MNVLDDFTSRVERWPLLDKIGDPVRSVVQAAIKPKAVRNTLSGTPLGHPLHALLTDFPIGAWSLASVLDLLGGERDEHAADLLVGTGLVAAIPTAAAGLTDWADTHGSTSRLGVAHAALNVTALSLYGASLVARRAGSRTAGKGLAFTGLGILLASGYLGGHLAYTKGVKVSRTAWHEGPTDWEDALAESELDDGKPHLAHLDDIPILVIRDAGRIVAIDNVCTHAGGSLDEGTVKDGCVTCPLHGSTFRLADGSVVLGPASAPQPSYEARVREGRVQLRARP
ncbi:Rieske 2Fe-2S domain-containing protein [Sinomonas albida]|uniref:Rieske 2Fe-2S domain-containing protein n=1 Tax=Sinomonas albida TaxID=369942 RepID=UPI0010A7B8EF|nr:Rieske 2Fe-2S domain-containing protein [Sinomonas albida]